MQLKANLPAPYLQNADAVTSEVARLHDLPDFVLSHFKYVTTNTAEHAPAVDDNPNFPVLIYLEGLTGYRQMSTFQVEELVSHGSGSFPGWTSKLNGPAKQFPEVLFETRRP